MATAKWIAGTTGGGLTWTDGGFTATGFNSLANGSTVVATTATDNSTNLDLYADFSFSLVTGGTTTANSYISIYLLPLNQDGTTYGDAVVTGAFTPAAAYLVGNVNVKSAVASGSAVVGMVRGIVLPPGSFKWAVQNNLTVALNAAAASATKYRTYSEQIS